MKTITKREYQVISLYARGLKFKEIALHLGIATRTAINYYMRVKTKDKGRVTRAKKSRTCNKLVYKGLLSQKIKEVKEYNEIRIKYTFVQSKIKSLLHELNVLRYNYILKSLEFAHISYNRFKLNLLKTKHL